MNILVLGTSNSILKNGYLTGVKRALPNATWTNLSSGASPGVQFARYIQMDFKQFDLVLLDSVPNDEQYGLQTPGYTYNEDYKQILFELISTISSQTRLVVIGIAVNDFLTKPSAVYRDRETFSQQANAQFIDFSQALRTYACQYNEVYSDHPAHPKPELSQQIGMYLGEAINAHFADLTKSEPSIDFSQHFTVDTAHLNEALHPLKTYKNSLKQDTFAQLKPGESIELSHAHSLIGFYVNGFQTNTALELVDAKGASQSASLFYKRKDNGFLSLFVPLASYDSVKRITVTDDSANEFDFKPRMTRQSRDSDSAKLEIGALIYWKKTKDANLDAQIAANRPSHLLLNDTIQQAVCREVLVALQTRCDSTTGFSKMKAIFALAWFKRRFNSKLTTI